MTLSRFRVSERQALHLIMLICFIGFVGAALAVIVHHRPATSEIVTPPTIRWLPPKTGGAGIELRHIVADMDDPSLLSLPDPRAYSHALWQHQAPSPQNLLQPPTTLAYLDSTPPREPSPLLPAASLSELVRGSAEKPPVTTPDLIADKDGTFSEHSVVQMDEPAGQLQLLRAPVLPSIISEVPLRSSRVRVAVAGDGTVLYAILDRPCGNDHADEVALTAANQLRFQLAPTTNAAPAVWCAVRFLWTTKSP